MPPRRVQKRDPDLCQACQKREPFPNRSRCSSCLIKQRKRDRARRARFRLLKVCLACGHPRKPGISFTTKRPYAHCVRCLRNYGHWAKGWRKRHPRAYIRGPRPANPVYKQIQSALRILGPATGTEIAEGLGLYRPSIWMQLKRMKDREMIRKVDPWKWDLVFTSRKRAAS